MCFEDKKHAYASAEIFDHYKKMCSTPDFKKKSERASKNRRTETGGPGTGIAVHTGGSISIYQHIEKLWRSWATFNCFGAMHILPYERS
ncbi:hypothetical protein Scep_002560 [Stephania cephalantha]|uniref:Uncharacterized protein n=1 Tax=Stephania cephalantha TaxID=152367 RepID=A0AAP0LE77_9MAGN